MKRLSFLRGGVIGFGISVVGAFLFSVLSMSFNNDLIIRCIIAGAGFFYVIQLMRVSGERVGFIATVVVWTIACTILLWWHPSLVLYLAAHTILIWLVRSLCFYSSVLSALADFGLSFLSFCAAIWAAIHTGDVFLSIWCFFLVQALSATIPTQFKKRTEFASVIQDDRFQRAYRMAESALSKLSSIH
jgi:hypothetical protein